MSTGADNLIEAIQAGGYNACIVLTGGGSGAVHALLSHPGASRFVLDVRIPYSPAALEDFLGKPPGSACSEETAREMASAAFRRAAKVGEHPLGIACTAALQTRRERKGADRAHICIQSLETVQYRFFEPASGSREQQEAEVSEALLRAIAEFVGVTQ